MDAPSSPSNEIMTIDPSSKKDIALAKVGATREIAYRAAVEALSARSMTVDKFGEEHFIEDHGNRLKAAEFIAKMNGDLKENAVNIDNRVVNVSGITSAVLEEFIKVAKSIDEKLASLRTSGQQTGEIIDVEAAGF